MPPSADRDVYHFTHVENLAQIFADGAIYADTVMASRAAKPVECADQSIKARRRAMLVEVAPFGVVADYVPFYFATRSPMMYSIHKGNVATYTRAAGELVYLTSSVLTIANAGLRWVTSDGNCATQTTDHYNDWLAGEAAIDWDVMRARIWRNTDEDGDRKRRRAAELLVHQQFPVSLVRGIVVKTTEIAEIARKVIPAHIPVWINPEHYF